MALTDEERAQLEALQAKDAEPEKSAPRKIVTVAADVLDTIRQLVHVHWQQIAPGIAQEFTRAVDEAKDEDGGEKPAEPEAGAEPEPADDQEPAPVTAGEPVAVVSAAEPAPEQVPAEPGPAAPPAFGSESNPGSEL